ncbi:MAG: phosphotyrosine protein phosphatase [Hirschia sp.]|nr:phosphotyrosine protein phosphatase [Hirschia sp.]MBF18810.1 phosphotyrosine protein phosphatase [Hirschia sp.]
MIHSILFVCLGNICRSPTAEGVFRKLSREARLDHLQIDSAGTGDWHSGKPPYGPMQTAAKKRGYDLSRLRARQFGKVDFSRFDLIIAMDQSNLANIERLRPRDVDTPVQLFLDYAPDQPLREVPDPYFTRDFDQALDLIEQASAGLLAHVTSPKK